MNQLLVFHENFQYLMIDKNLNKKFYVNKLKTSMFEATNDD